MTLNPAQQAAVSSTASLRVVIAGPGSGKTRTMVEAVKAARACAQPASRIAIMTFTNAGANEFRKRLENHIDEIIGRNLQPYEKELIGVKLAYCGTLHGYCFRLIQRFGNLIGYIPGKVGILPDKERIPRLLACRDKLGVKISEKVLLAGQQRVSEALSYDGHIQDQVGLVWKEYGFLLKRNNLVDYDGILEEAVLLLTKAEVLKQIRLDYLFVDEYQDSAQIDQLIYEAIPALNKMYVGDGDQSIFAFRGANPMGFVHLANSVFGNSITDAEGFKLELNYRSGVRICEAAGRLIAHNNERVPKQIKPTTPLMGHAIVEGHEDVVEELAWLAALVRPCLENYDGVAVLYRMNHEVKQCRDYLLAMGIPITAPKWEQRPPDWERALLILGLVASPENEILAERFLKLTYNAKNVDEWILHGRVTGRTLWQQAKPQGFGSWAYPDGLLRILAENGIIESTVRLIQQRAELMAPDATGSDLLHDLHSDEAPKASDDAGVYVGTIHSAKGREWDVVFLPAFEQGIIPHVLKEEAATNYRFELEEERRLAFVAVTRARHELYLSHCQHRQGKWGPVGTGQPSQFIKEMGL